MDSNWVLVGVVVIFILIFVFCSCMKKRVALHEPYTDLFSATNFARNNWVSRPTFRADLSPRFDSSPARSGAINGSPPPLSMQGAPISPVAPVSGLAPNQKEGYSVSNNFASLGQAYDSRMPTGGLTTNQVNEILAQKFGRNGAGDYTEPSSLLPEPDMRSAVSRDPSNPSTFMYDRYLFAPLKRRSNNPVDFIRGDLTIAPLRVGWFDVPTPVKADIAQGYFADYTDIQQASNILDTVYERKPTPLQNANSWGNLQGRTMSALL